MDEHAILIAKIKICIRLLESKLVKEIDPIKISKIAKIPFKALELREVLLYRITDLAKASCELFESDNLVSSACTTRAFQETLALLFYINRKVKKAIQDKEVDHLDECLMRALMGGRNNDEMPNSVNVLTAIQHVNKELSEFGRVYDILSELSHPNWAGTTGIYSKLNDNNNIVKYGRNIKIAEATRIQIVNTLLASLQLVTPLYDEFTGYIPTLTSICEEAIANGTDV